MPKPQPLFTPLDDNAMVFEGRVYSLTKLPTPTTTNYQQKAELAKILNPSQVRLARKIAKMSAEQIEKRITNDLLTVKKKQLMKDLGQSRVKPCHKRDYPEVFVVSETEMNREKARYDRMVTVLRRYEMVEEGGRVVKGQDDIRLSFSA